MMKKGGEGERPELLVHNVLNFQSSGLPGVSRRLTHVKGLVPGGSAKARGEDWLLVHNFSNFQSTSVLVASGGFTQRRGGPRPRLLSLWERGGRRTIHHPGKAG